MMLKTGIKLGEIFSRFQASLVPYDDDLKIQMSRKRELKKRENNQSGLHHRGQASNRKNYQENNRRESSSMTRKRPNNLCNVLVSWVAITFIEYAFT